MEPELVVGIGVLGLLVGAGLGYLMGNRGTKKTRVVELENSLENAQEELSDYKREVVGQFAETADKFRALDKSYHDLHRHLAESSVALCGDAGMSLLDKPASSTLEESVREDSMQEQPILEQVDEEIVLVETSKEDPVIAPEITPDEINPETNPEVSKDDLSSAVADSSEISNLKEAEQKAG